MHLLADLFYQYGHEGFCRLYCLRAFSGIGFGGMEVICHSYEGHAIQAFTGGFVSIHTSNPHACKCP